MASYVFGGKDINVESLSSSVYEYKDIRGIGLKILSFSAAVTCNKSVLRYVLCYKTVGDAGSPACIELPLKFYLN